MALTEAQIAALEEVRARRAGTEDDEQNRIRRQWQALDAVRPQVPEAPTPTDDVGFVEGLGNAGMRGLSNLRSIPDAMMAENLAAAADAQEEMNRREADGEMTFLDRVATWRPSWAAPLETPEELRGLAADNAQAVAQRSVDAQENYPMTQAGAQAIQELSEADGFIDGLGTVLTNPLATASGVAQVAAEQIPTIAGAGLATAVTKNPAVGVGAFASSGYAQERFGQLVPEASKEGYNLLDRRGALDAVSDTEFMQDQAARGATRGAIIGTVDLLTAGLASKAPLTRAAVARQAGIQVAGGGGGEAAAQLATDGEIQAGEVIIEALAEGVSAPADVAAFALTRPANQGSDINTQEAQLRAEEDAQLEAQALAEQQAEGLRVQAEAETTARIRREAAATFTPRAEFVAGQQQLVTAQLQADLRNPEAELGSAFEANLNEKSIFDPADVEAEAKAFLKGYQKETKAATDAQINEAYVAALDGHVGRLRDLETLLTSDPAAEQQLEMDLAPAEDTATQAPDSAPTAETPDGQLEMDLAPVEDTAPQAPDPVRLATELVKATGVTVDERVTADISARMSQIVELPVAERATAARALVANYTTPGQKTAGRRGSTAPAAGQQATQGPESQDGQMGMDLRQPSVAEPEVPADVVRMYHGGALGGTNTWTSDRPRAEVMANGGDMNYVDIPKTDDRLEAAAINDFKTTAEFTLAEEDLAALGGANTLSISQNASQPNPTTKTTKRERLRADAVAQLGENFEQNHPELSQLLSDGKGIYSRGKGKPSRFEAMLAKTVAEQNAEAQAAATPVEQAPTAAEQAATPATQEDTATPPVVAKKETAAEALSSMDAQAETYAKEKLGDNWRETNPALVELLNGKKYAGFQTTVDSVAAEAPARIEDVAQQIIDADSTPKELRNQKSFKESYAEKDGRSSALFSNPGLTEAAQMADWLGSLTQAQWDKINPAFANNLNPFKNPGSIDYNADRAKLEALLAPTQETVDAPTPATTEPTTDIAAVFTQDVPSDVKLSPNEQKVFEALQQAFANNEQDDVIQSDGRLNPQRIADRAGMNSRQAAQTALTRLRPKLAKAYGVSQEQIKQRLAETKNKSTEAFDPNEAAAEVDLAELGDSMGTVASANQGARTGMAKEDRDFLDNMEETPNRVQTPEQLAAIRAEFDAEVKAHRMYPEARENWDGFFEVDIENPADKVPFDSMDAGTRFDFFTSYLKYMGGKLDVNALGSEYDALRRDYLKDVENEKTQIANEGRQIESRESPEGTGPTGGEVRSEGNDTAGDGPTTAAEFKTGQQVTVSVYHGSNQDVADFDEGRLGSNTNAASAGEAFFFAGKPETASSYAENTSETAKDEAFKLSFAAAKKYLSGGELTAREMDAVAAMLTQSRDLKGGDKFVSDIQQRAEEYPKQITTLARRFATQLRPAPRPTVQLRDVRLTNPLVYDFKGERYREETYFELIKKAKAAGHDGVILMNTYDVAGKTSDQLTKDDEDNIFAVFNSDSIRESGNWGARDGAPSQKRKKIDPKKAKTSNPRFGVRDNATATASREAFEQSVNELTGDTQNVRIHVFDTEADALAAVENGDVPSADTDEIAKVQPYGWVQEDENGVPHAHFILDRIPAGGERAAFMHEVGGHVGIDNVLDEASRTKLASQIADWAGANDGSLESKLALRTLRRMDLAAMRGGVSDGVVVSEAIAYFLEEATLAGVDPTAGDAVGNFVQRIYDAFKAAFEALGLSNTDTLVAQDIVDMAYGAARFELMEGSLDPTTTTAPFQRPSYGVNPNQETRTEATRAYVKENLGDAAVKFLDDASFIARNAVDSTKFLHQFIRENKETMPSAGRWYNGMLEAEKTRNDIRRSVESIATQARDLAADRLDAVNDFIGSSTFYQKWGYDPEVEGKTVKVDPIMKRRFDKLSPKEQQLVKDIFAHGETMRLRKQEIAKKLGVQGKFFSDAALEGPYAPLKRFGNFVGQLKSQELLDAEAELRENRSAETRKRVDDLKSNEDHYVISFFDTMGAAKQFADANREKFTFAVASERSPDMESDRVASPEVFDKILGQLRADNNSGIDASAKTAFAEMVKKMYFQSLDERSARQSGARRMNRAGYEKNMLRSFLSHARAEAALVANMEHGAEINTAFAEANVEASQDEANLRSVYNMVAKHYRDTLVGKETPIQDRLAAMNSVYMLTTSVGYHVTNATQPMMVTIPRLAGDFKNYSGAWGALARGYKVSVKAAKMGKNLEADIDVSKAPPKYRKLLEDLQLRQLLDVGMEEDLSEFDRFNTGYEPLNRLGDKLGTVVHKLYQVARFVEAHNRISAAVAAYDMALANPETTRRLKMTPEEYATAVVEDTQGNFARFDSPYVIKALPKMTTQYRKYQLMMGWAYGNAFNQAFMDKSISPEEKAMGKRVLGYTLTHAGVFAGVTGVPLVTTLAPYVLGWIEGEDEPQDLERWIRENVENERLADVLSRGVFSAVGVDMSTKLSQSKIFHPFPYVDFEASEDGVRDIFFNALAGPSGTTALNFGRSAEYFGQGDILKGIEYSVPKGLRTIIESYRLGTEGFSAKNGDVLVDPREFDMQSLLLNALGIPSTDVQRFKWTRGQQFELSQYVSNESSRIRREYIQAKDDGDRARMTELRDEWRELQDQKDRIRPFFGNSREMRRQSVGDLIRAPRRQDRRERRAQQRFE
jgi:hypothetical protein